MLKTTTLSAKSESFQRFAIECLQFWSRTSCGKLMAAAGGAVFLAGGVFVTRLAGALVGATSLELQLDKPRALIRPTALSVRIIRPGLQKDLFPVSSEEDCLGKAI